jgi:hypothetical protein
MVIAKGYKLSSSSIECEELEMAVLAEAQIGLIRL